MEALYPVSAIMDGVGLNLTVMSYDGDLNFGVVADRELIADPWPLAEALQRAQAELLALVPEPPSRPPPDRDRTTDERTNMFEFDITQTNIAVERLLEGTENPRHRFLLQAYNRHRYLEMAGRYKEIFAPEMTVEHPVYRFNLLGQIFTLNGREEVEAIYREWTETDQCIFYVEDEQLAVGDNMIVSRATLYQQTPGAVLAAAGVEADQDAMYLAKTREAMIWPYDDACRLIGEDVWEYDPSAREFIKLDPATCSPRAQAGELLDPLIKPLPSFDEAVGAAT